MCLHGCTHTRANVLYVPLPFLFKANWAGHFWSSDLVLVQSTKREWLVCVSLVQSTRLIVPHVANPLIQALRISSCGSYHTTQTFFGLPSNRIRQLPSNRHPNSRIQLDSFPWKLSKGSFTPFPVYSNHWILSKAIFRPR